MRFSTPSISPSLSLALAAIALVSTACSKEPDATSQMSAKERETVAIAVARSVVQPLQRSIEVVGTLYGDEEATISAKVPGRVATVFKDVGDGVDLGEPLAQIETTDYALARTQQEMAVQETLSKLGLSEMPPGEFDAAKVPTVERARLQAQNAEAKFRRGEQLYRKTPPLLSDQDFADLQSTFDVARSAFDVELLSARSLLAAARTRRAELDQASQRLADTTVRAPGTSLSTTQPASRAALGASAPEAAPVATKRSGRSDRTGRAGSARFSVAARLVSVGEYVREGTAMFRVVASDPIKFRAQVPEKFASQLALRQSVRVSVEAHSEHFLGSVSRINPQVDLASRSFQVEVLVPNERGILQPGSFARASILTIQQPGVTFVPEAAVVTFAGVNKVFSIDDGKAVEHKVQLGVRADGLVEIAEGFEGAREVAVRGANKLAAGTPVTIKAADAAATTQPTTTHAAG